MRSRVVLWISVLLCGCPGDPVEGSGGADAGATSSDASATMTTASASATMGSQSASGSTDGSVSMSVTDAEETASDPTSATLEETGTPETGSDTIAETGTTAGGSETTSLSAGTTDGTTETGECVDASEPNEVEAMAIDVGVVDCNGASIDVASVANDPTSPDWFRFTGTWSEVACGGGDSEPRVEVSAGGPLEVCAFADCPATETVVCTTGILTDSPDGRPGCCGTDDAHLALDCPGGGDEGGLVMVRVTTTGAACTDYTLQLTF